MKNHFLLACFVISAVCPHIAVSAEYVPGALYVKFRPASSKKAQSGTPAHDILARFGAYESRQAFTVPETMNAAKMSAESRRRLESLASIKLVQFPRNLDMEYFARKISALPDIEYAEPVYISRFCLMPNDPFFNPDSSRAQQAYLSFIHAPEAWDIARGDTSVVIAIVDSGTDWNHHDLRDNLWTNLSEIPNNGIDDDKNGFIDDVHGWDFVGATDIFNNTMGDNDPTSAKEPHGTHVTGIAAAVTNNGFGIASLSYNVHYMPVKVSGDNSENLTYGFEGILYAVANGADIVNCSWGSPQFSNTEKEVIDYALSRGVIIIASAGNDNSDLPFYPAAYTGVVSVGSIDLYGKKSFFSNYGPTVDISVPGELIYSTVLKNSYEYYSGTSMAAPVVSALAALVKSAHKDWDTDRIKAQIMGTASPMVLDNSTSYLCGCGYIDAEKALGKPALHIEVMNHTFTNKNGNEDNIFSPGETVEASITMKNMGEDVTNVTVSFISLAGYLTPLEKSIFIGSLAHQEEKTISDISFTIKKDIAFDSKDFVRLDFESSEGSMSFATIDIVLNPSYGTFTANTIEFSVNGKGNIGYVDFPDNTKGSPFIIRTTTSSQSGVFNVPLLFEGGLLIGNSPARISDCIRGSDQAVADKEFVITSPFLFERAPDVSMQKGTVAFSDKGAGDRKSVV
jgi:subtilisin family serine protease